MGCDSRRRVCRAPGIQCTSLNAQSFSHDLESQEERLLRRCPRDKRHPTLRQEAGAAGGFAIVSASANWRTRPALCRGKPVLPGGSPIVLAETRKRIGGQR